MNEHSKLAFDIGEIPENIDLSLPPVSGLDYLYRVRLETEKCPDVVVSSIDTAKFAHRQNIQIDDCNGFIPAPPGFKPGLGWQKQELELFQSYKTQLENNREMLKTKFSKREYPKISNKVEWCRFCLGSESHDRIYCKSLSETTDDEAVSKRKKPRRSNKGTPPFLSIMLHLSQVSIIKLISYHIQWLEDLKFSHDQGKWLYALLLRLETPLEPDTCALLRNLSRVCSKLRADLSDPQDETLKALNIFIVIIANLFEQKDMSDEFLQDYSAN